MTRRERRAMTGEIPTTSTSAAAELSTVKRPASEVEPSTVTASQAESAGRDETDAFSRAMRALDSTAEVTVRSGDQETVGEADAATAGENDAPRGLPSVAHAIPRGSRHRSSKFRRTAAATLSLGAMAAVGMLAVGMTTPVGALAQVDPSVNPAAVTATDAEAKKSVDGAEEEIQAFVAAPTVENAEVQRSDGYEATTFAAVASAKGIDTGGAFFTNDPSADIQWPFAVGVGMSYGYGMRSGRMHEGIDFTPGGGAPIQAIADGTVRIATEAGGAYGVTVYIDHVIDGQTVTSHYAHMRYGSLRVSAGQQVEVGDVIGLTGNTGRSYGAHLHFEIIVNGATIDPMPWLREHAGTHFPEEIPDITLEESIAE